VAGLFVFGSRVAEADDQAYGHGCVCNGKENIIGENRQKKTRAANLAGFSLRLPHCCGGKITSCQQQLQQQRLQQQRGQPVPKR
jgi:hypothetical protein